MQNNTRDVVEKVIKMLISQKGIKQADVARSVGMLPAAFNNFLRGNFTQIVRFINIAKLCDYDIVLKNKYFEINLSEAVEMSKNGSLSEEK